MPVSCQPCHQQGWSERQYLEMVATQFLDVGLQQHWFAEYTPVGTGGNSLTETVSLSLVLSEVEIHYSLQDQVCHLRNNSGRSQAPKCNRVRSGS